MSLSVPPMPEDERWSPEARALLETRTRAVARPADEADPRNKGTEVLWLRVAGERYAIPLTGVCGVAELVRLTPLPHAPPEVAGLTVRGGDIVPVFYLRAVLGLPLTTLPEHGRIVLLGESEGVLALVVDAIEGSTRIALDTLMKPPGTVGPDVAALLLGVDAEGAPVLDPDGLLGSPRLVVDIHLPAR